jgi:hypothetical protein
MKISTLFFDGNKGKISISVTFKIGVLLDVASSSIFMTTFKRLIFLWHKISITLTCPQQQSAQAVSDDSAKFLYRRHTKRLQISPICSDRDLITQTSVITTSVIARV